MSTMQRMTLIGVYEYFNSFGQDLFSDLTLPEGYDKSDFVNSLLLEHGEKCVLYSNPDFLKQAIGTWGRKWFLELSRIYDALTAEYNPLHNYDRFEEWKDNEGRKYSSTVNAGHKATDSPDYTVSQTTDGSTEHQVSADNSSSYQPDYKDTINAGATKTSGKAQDLSETSNSKTMDEETHNFTHNGHLYGNIGVTTSSAMIVETLEMRYKYNLYATAGRIFANELLIGIY